MPLVLYQGRGSGTVSPQFHDWLDLPEECREELAPMQPQFAHLLVDPARVPLEAIQGELLVRLALTLMKAAREDRMEEWLDKVEDETVKTDVMSIAEQLMQKGQQECREEGWRKGRLVGQIQMRQKLLHQPVSPDEALERREVSEL